MMKCDGYIGSRIRQYRTLAKLTQKELAQRCGISEPAIRNYELGNRLPDEETLKTIALALEINYYALKQPDPSTLAGALNTLYLLESMYGLAPEIDGDEIKFVFKNRPAYTVPYITPDDINDFKDLIKTWIDAKENLIGADFDESTLISPNKIGEKQNGLIDKSEYEFEKKNLVEFVKSNSILFMFYDSPHRLRI